MTTKKKRASHRKKLRVLVLMHEDFVPPEDVDSLSETDFHRIKTESHILGALAKLGHEAKPLGVRDAVSPIRHAIEDWKPDIVFNLLDEFQGEAIYDQHVVALLELLRAPTPATTRAASSWRVTRHYPKKSRCITASRSRTSSSHGRVDGSDDRSE